MSELEVGRAGLDVAMAHPKTIRWSSTSQGRILSISGHLKDTTTLAEALILRDQLTRQVKGPKSSGFVPVHSSVDTSIDGYFILTSANVSASHALGSYAATGFFTYSATLQEVDTTEFEVVVSGGVLTNDHSKTALNADNISLVGDVSAYYPYGDATTVSRRAEGRRTNVVVAPYVYVAGARDFTVPDVHIYSVAPWYFYEAACEIKVGGFVVAGNPVFSLVDADYPTNPMKTNNWEIGNGLIRIKGVANSASQFTIEQYDWNADDWESSTEFYWRRSQSATFGVTTWNEMIVLRNDPEEVAIRFIGNNTTSSPTHRFALDFSLRRGCQYVRGYGSVKGQSFTTMAVFRSSTDAATSFTYGVHDSANDSDGNRWVLGSRETVTKDTTYGGITKSTTGGYDSQYLDFFLGMEFGGTGASVNYDTAEKLGDHYVNHVSEKVYPILSGGILP